MQNTETAIYPAAPVISKQTEQIEKCAKLFSAGQKMSIVLYSNVWFKIVEIHSVYRGHLGLLIPLFKWC
jgi:hypothetical protein